MQGRAPVHAQGQSEVSMRWTRIGVGLGVGLGTLAAAIQPVAAQGQYRDPAPRKPIYEEQDRSTGAVFSAAPDDQGSVRFLLRVEDLAVEKIVSASGDTTIRLTQGKDVVTIMMNHSGYIVQRGRRTARFDPQVGTVADVDAIRGVLLGSSAVRSFRKLATALENRDESEHDTPLMLGALVDGAIVQLLDGDAGAPTRIGKRITRNVRARMKPAKFMPADLLFEDCVLRYEMSLLDAFDLLGQCQDSAWHMPWYYWFLGESFCEFEWLLRSQQYIYQFMGCFAYPF